MTYRISSNRSPLLVLEQCRQTVRKFGFSSRLVNTWNSIVYLTVLFPSAYSTDIFKARLDQFWHSQDIVYDFRAQLQGTGSRSEVLCEKFQ